jgi:hypothetical protein
MQSELDWGLLEWFDGLILSGKVLLIFNSFTRRDRETVFVSDINVSEYVDRHGYEAGPLPILEIVIPSVRTLQKGGKLHPPPKGNPKKVMVERVRGIQDERARINRISPTEMEIWENGKEVEVHPSIRRKFTYSCLSSIDFIRSEYYKAKPEMWGIDPDE